MRNYLSADLFRLFRYLPLWIALGIALAIYMGASFLISGVAFSPDRFEGVLGVYSVILPLIAGLGVMGFVFNHDIRAGALKVAIGRGVSRDKVVAVKLIELVVLTFLAMAALFALSEVWNLAIGIRLDQAHHLALLAVMLSAALQVLVYGTIAGAVAFARQETTASTTVFALLASGVFEVVLALILNQRAVIDLVGDLSRYLPRNLAAELGQAWTSAGSASIVGMVVMALYFIVPAVLTRQLFIRTELDF